MSMPKVRRGIVAILTAALLLFLTGCTLTYQPPGQLTDAQKMVVLAKPAVVRPVVSVEIEWIFKDEQLANVVGANPFSMQTGGMGSGWFITPDGYIVTNAHVVEWARISEQELLPKLFPYLIQHIESQIGQQLTEADIQFIVANTDYRRLQRDVHVYTPGGDRLRAEIKSYGVSFVDDVSGKDVAVLKVEGRNFPTLIPGDSDQVSLQERIFIMGFPGAADFVGGFDWNALLEATISDGTVQARKATEQGTPVLQVGGAASPGNSGGPVTLIDGRVIGILTAGPLRAQGISFVVPMNTVMEFVRQAGAVPAPSVTSQKFAEAMDLYWRGRYSQAIVKFEEILRLTPSHAEARRYLQEAQARRHTQPFIDPALLAVIAGMLLLVGGGTGAMVWRRRSARTQPATATAGGGRAVTTYAAPAAGSVAGRAAAGGATAVGARTAPSVPATTVLKVGLGHLRFTAGPLAGQRVRVPAQGVTLGREPGGEGLTIPDERVSRRHCWIGPAPGGQGVIITDQGSTNGTYVGSPASGRIQQADLKPGDLVYLASDGSIAFVFEA